MRIVCNKYIIICFGAYLADQEVSHVDYSHRLTCIKTLTPFEHHERTY